MKLYPALSCLGLFLAGCTTTTELSRSPDENTLAEVNNRLSGSEVEVSYVDGRKVLLDSANLVSDCIIGLHQESGSQVEISQADIQSFQARPSLDPAGAGLGALIGAVSVGVTTYLVGISLMDAIPLAVSPQTNLAPYVTAGVFVGGVVGGVVGGHPSSEIYTFDTPAAGEPTKQADGSVPSKMVTLQITSIQEETPDQICIKWNGRPVWLPRSEAKIQRVGEHNLLTVPARLLTEE